MLRNDSADQDPGVAMLRRNLSNPADQGKALFLICKPGTVKEEVCRSRPWLGGPGFAMSCGNPSNSADQGPGLAMLRGNPRISANQDQN